MVHNNFILKWQIKPKPVYSTWVHRPTLQYKGIQNQFTVQGYTKPVYRNVQGTDITIRNVQGTDITIQVNGNFKSGHYKHTKPDCSLLSCYFRS